MGIRRRFAKDKTADENWTKNERHHNFSWKGSKTCMQHYPRQRDTLEYQVAKEQRSHITFKQQNAFFNFNSTNFKKWVPYWIIINIRNATKKHSGNYTCLVETEVDFDQSSSKVKVKLKGNFLVVYISVSLCLIIATVTYLTYPYCIRTKK